MYLRFQQFIIYIPIQITEGCGKKQSRMACVMQIKPMKKLQMLKGNFLPYFDNAK